MSNIHTLYKEANSDFGVDLDIFNNLIASAVPEGKVASHRLMKTFDCEAAGVVDVLEVLCGLVCAVQGSLPEKIEKVFECFDFDGSGKITYDEMFILIFTCLRALVRVQGKGVEPEDSDVEKMVDEIFLKADKVSDWRKEFRGVKRKRGVDCELARARHRGMLHCACCACVLRLRAPNIPIATFAARSSLAACSSNTRSSNTRSLPRSFCRNRRHS